MKNTKKQFYASVALLVAVVAIVVGLLVNSFSSSDNTQDFTTSAPTSTTTTTIPVGQEGQQTATDVPVAQGVFPDNSGTQEQVPGNEGQPSNTDTSASGGYGQGTNSTPGGSSSQPIQNPSDTFVPPTVNSIAFSSCEWTNANSVRVVYTASVSGGSNWKPASNSTISGSTVTVTSSFQPNGNRAAILSHITVFSGDGASFEDVFAPEPDGVRFYDQCANRP